MYKIDLVGRKFGYLTVIKQVRNNTKCHCTRWLCKCDCGNLKEINRSNLVSGSIKSCGCLSIKNKELFRERNNIYKFHDKYGMCAMKNGYNFIFDIEDYNKIKNHYWIMDSKGYVIASCIKKNNLLSNIITGKSNINYINKNLLDNRKENFRIGTKSEIAITQMVQKNNKSGTTGVSFSKRTKKWVVGIKVNYKQIHLGYYEKLEDAIKTRKNAEIKYFGNFLA